jgi:hypothetical protein
MTTEEHSIDQLEAHRINQQKASAEELGKKGAWMQWDLLGKNSNVQNCGGKICSQ